MKLDPMTIVLALEELAKKWECTPEDFTEMNFSLPTKGDPTTVTSCYVSPRMSETSAVWFISSGDDPEPDDFEGVVFMNPYQIFKDLTERVGLEFFLSLYSDDEALIGASIGSTNGPPRATILLEASKDLFHRWQTLFELTHLIDEIDGGEEHPCPDGD